MKRPAPLTNAERDELLRLRRDLAALRCEFHDLKVRFGIALNCEVKCADDPVWKDKTQFYRYYVKVLGGPQFEFDYVGPTGDMIHGAHWFLTKDAAEWAAREFRRRHGVVEPEPIAG